MDNFIKIITTNPVFPDEKAVIALGVFDGVHPGHRKVIASAVELAHRLQCRTGVVTFVPHPRQVLGNDDALKLLMPELRRVEELQKCGADFVAQINFSMEIARWDAEAFLQKLRDCGLFKIAGICVGSNWKFGKNGSGNRELLSRFCQNSGIGFIPVPEIKAGENIVSSSWLRKLTADGEFEEIRRIYGTYPEIYGTVQSGMRAAGKDLNAPTANIELEYGVMVPDGVYAGSVQINGTIYPAVLNIGPAPTYSVEERRIEVHLIGFSGNLYGTKQKVTLIRKLRDICKFDSIEMLKNQIRSDIENARSIVNDAHIRY